MPEIASSLSRFLYPLVLGAFLVIYVSGLLNGAMPELALLQAAGFGLGFAVLARWATRIVDAATAAPAAEQADAQSQTAAGGLNQTTSQDGASPAAGPGGAPAAHQQDAGRAGPVEGSSQ